jgi:hypothetical protein
MNSVPRSAYDQVGGMVYFARMLDKIRLFHQGLLPAEYHENLGRGADSWCADFLRIPYADLKARVLEGGSDEEILEWCYQKGRRLNEGDLRIYNQFCKKLGWNDFATPTFKKYKQTSGLSSRDDIITMFDYFEVDEGRKA